MNTQQKRPGDRGEPAKFREYQDGSTRRDPVVDEWVGQVAASDQTLFQALSEAYRSDGDSFGSTDIYERLRRVSANRNASRAIRQGDMFTLQNMVGETSQKRDISGVKTIRMLRDKLSRPAYVCYLHGVMGDGKTDWAFLLGEIWQDEMDRQGYNTVVASNVQTCEQTETVDNWDDFEAWLDDATEDERRLFIFDEASKHAAGYAADKQDARELLGKTINLIRKSFSSIIVIGHTGMDVHPDIRRKCTHLMRKKGKKDVEIRERVDTGDGEGEIQTTARVGGIPPTNWVYDTYESSGWDWGGEDDVEEELREQLRAEVEEKKATRDEAIRRMYRFTPLSCENIAGEEWVDVSKRQVQRIVGEVEKVEGITGIEFDGTDIGASA